MRAVWTLRSGVVVAAMAALGMAASCSDDTEADRNLGGEGGAGGGAGAAGPGGAGTGAGATTGTGATSTGATTGSGGSTTTGGTVCSDVDDEPNDSEATAIDLGEFNDCDANGGIVEGTLNGDDEDWYTYSGLDEAGCSVDASRALTADGTVRICKFAECDGLALSCPGGTTPETSPGGRMGCCGTTDFDVAPDCSGFSDDALIFIRLDKPPAFDCVNYTLAYHY